MKDQIKSLEEVVTTVEGPTKHVLIGMLDLMVQIADRNQELEVKIAGLQGALEQMTGGPKKEASGGFSIG